MFDVHYLKKLGDEEVMDFLTEYMRDDTSKIKKECETKTTCDCLDCRHLLNQPYPEFSLS